MKSITILACLLLCCCCNLSFAQEDPTRNVLDDVQIDLKHVKLDPEHDTLTVELFLISYQRQPREFKLNTYATQVTDDAGERHFFTSIEMGRVLLRLADKQNYLHYLLEDDVPVSLTIKVADWKSKAVPRKIALVFEDSTEEGKFITQEVDLK
ncbi:hypothetical protein [Sphingobacterium sp. LRF_L2]|uniref:hypothetical protein n=1 Tax=Sphingobacterium sp. LRF_L2 TaxID=3369421 RepID=UPI003F615509